MNILTSGYELTTAITNVFIFIVSLYGAFKIKKDKLWKLFFILMSIDSFMGVVVHGFKMSTKLNNILWVILSVFFAISVNTLFSIFLKYKYKHIAVLSLLLGILLLTQFALDMDYLLTFVIYVLLIMLISFAYIFIDNYDNKKWFVIGFIVQVIGGIFLLCRVKYPILNYNGVCHMFTVATLILFYIGIKNNNKLCYNLDNGE